MTTAGPLIVDRRFLTLSGQLPESLPENAVLLIDKPKGWTSADAVRKIKFGLQKRFRLKNVKVGHAGTLDPLATGVLVLCIGRATKSAQDLQAGRKEYLAGITFGATTPTFDMEKEIDATYPYGHITVADIKSALRGMEGEQMQYPPVYSAKYVDGMRAYEMARAGQPVDLKASAITIYGTHFIDYAPPVLSVRIECSKGTYIRAFARDLGLALGSGAYLSELRRTASGDFKAEDCLTMEDAVGLLG